MGKRIIYTEDGSPLNPEIEMFVNNEGKVSIIVKYEKDEDVEIRCITLESNDFEEMTMSVVSDINNFNDGKTGTK